jgi:hypothetical protein
MPEVDPVTSATFPSKIMASPLALPVAGED